MANPGETASGAPLLETCRLRLRGHGLHDYAALSAIRADPEVVRCIGGVPPFAHQTTYLGDVVQVFLRDVQ